MSKAEAFASEPIDGIDMVPIVTDRGQVEWFRLLVNPKDGLPSHDNVSCYGGDCPVYFDTQVRRLRLSAKSEEAGWRFYVDICRRDAKAGAKWWEVAQTKIKPMVRHPNKHQAWKPGPNKESPGTSTFDPAQWYHPEVVELRKQFDSSGRRLVDMTTGPDVK